ncbi:hypothetical protein BCR44DRAFT_61766 [Catenaria anguillulae PL171]|uniref:Enkurin domain-containing protein n=1 Tax=Catenaria anguillulae PL171 TaxID=765915 RepID=A0A1Y2HQD3_9FUNG|nr:hypothetical protein BCR44DRAFT_61766 [Catenaria anguillulae PL171]
MFVPRSPTQPPAGRAPAGSGSGSRASHLDALLTAKWNLDNSPLPPCPFKVVPTAANADSAGVAVDHYRSPYSALLAAAAAGPSSWSANGSAIDIDASTTTAAAHVDPDTTLADLLASSTLSAVPAAPPAPVPDLNLAALQQELDQARLDLGSLQRENSFLRSALDAAQQDLRTAADSQPQSSAAEQPKECTQCQEYESYVSRLESESIFMRERTRDLALQVDQLRDQLDSRPAPNAGTSRASSPSPTAQSTMIDQAQISALTTVSDELKRQLDAANERVRALESAVIDRDHALDTLTTNLHQLRSDRGNIQSQLESVQSERDTLHDERNMLMEQRRVVIEKFDERVHAEVGARIKEEVGRRVAHELEARVRQAMEGAQVELDSAAVLVNELEAELAAEKTEAVRLHRANAGLVEEVEALKLALTMENKEVHAREEQLMRENHDLHMKLDRAHSQLRVLQSTVDQVMNSPATTTTMASPALARTPYSPSTTTRPGSVSFRIDTPTSNPTNATAATHVPAGPGSPTLAHRSLALNHTASQPNLRAAYYANASSNGTPSSTSMTLPRSPAPGASPYTPHQAAGRPYSMIQDAWTEETPVRNGPTPTGDSSASGRSTPARPMSMLTPSTSTSTQAPAAESRFSDAKWRQQVETARHLELQLRDLIALKETLQGDYSRVPLAATTLNRRRKEELEAKLDEVEREIGSVRRRLKTMNFL